MAALRLLLFLASRLVADTVLAQVPSADRLTLRIYNRAEVAAGALERSKVVADRVFDRVDVEILWLNCSVNQEPIPLNPACRERAAATHLVINILPRGMGRNYGFKRPVFGFALPATDGRPGFYASLFFERVLDLAYHGGVGTSFEHAQAIILGHMMAHEAGHLLLGMNSHSPSGVMSFPWDRSTLKRMARGLLGFSPDEAQRIRTELKRRVEWDR